MVTVSGFLCCRLRTAGVFFGWLGAASSLFSLVLFSILLAETSRKGPQPPTTPQPSPTPDPDDVYSLAITVFALYLVIAAINLVASLALIIGTIRERHLLLVPWLINRTLSIVVSVLILLSVIVYVAKLPDSPDNKKSESIPVFIGLIASIAFESWLWVVIYSLFKQIRTSSEQQPLMPNPVGGVPVYPSYTRI